MRAKFHDLFFCLPPLFHSLGLSGGRGRGLLCLAAAAAAAATVSLGADIDPTDKPTGCHPVTYPVRSVELGSVRCGERDRPRDASDTRTKYPRDQ